MDDIKIEPQGLPKPVTADPRAIDLYRIVIIALAAIGLLVVVGGIVLAVFGAPMPESVVVLGSVAVGALAGMIGAERA